jgi:molecular chaperone DnaJ
MRHRPDYYAVLGLEPGCSAEDIKRAYRRLARQHHPDVNASDSEAEERFKLISQAYQVLSDPAKRSAYDAGGFMGDDVLATGPDGAFGDLFDLVDAMFGGGFASRARGRASASSARGRDLHAEVELSLLDALHGVTREVAYRRVAPCSACDGTGAAPGSSRQTCTTCGGHGRVQYVQSSFFGQVSTVTECPDCAGRGSVLQRPCRECRGLGVAEEEQTVRAEVPPGAEDGAALHVPGYGDFPADARGRPGDLYLTVRVTPHPVFRREGAELYASLELNAAEAALGCTVRFETLDGPVDVDVRPGLQPGEEVLVRGRGLPGRKGKRGDLHLVARVTVPPAKSRRERELLEELRGLWGETEQ